MKKLLLLLTFALLTTAGFGQAGALDTTFGIGGKLIPNPNAPGGDRKMALQPDGKIVVAATDFSGFFGVFRYLPDGANDQSFGINGQVITDFGTAGQPVSAFSTAVALQPDGKIVVAGSASPDYPELDFAVARYNTDGSLDSSFSGDGKAILSLGSIPNDAYLKVVAVHEGKIIVAGTYTAGSSILVGLARFNADGSPDSTFSQNGWLAMGFGTTPNYVTVARDMVVQPDGKIIVAGDYESTSSFEADFVLMRFKTNGSLDNTFSGDGKVRADMQGGLDIAEAVVLQPDGKILAAGGSFVNSMALARYLPDGTPDSTFGTDGKVTTSPDPNLGIVVLGMTVQPDGKVVVASQAGGVINNVYYSDLALIRYQANGTLDPDFGDGGIVTTDFDLYDSGASSVLMQPDGKILALGYAGDASGQFFVLARYLSGLSVDGVLDFSLSPSTLLVYPNPVGDVATLEYELAQSETITIQLFDMQGRMQCVFIQAEEQSEGPHQVDIRLPEDLPSGHYVLSIANTRGRVSLQIVK